MRHPIVFFLLSLCLVAACDEGKSSKNDTGTTASCVGCHTNYEVLKAIASPDTATGGGGCGGEAPHIEPYDRVYLSETGFAVFASSAHGQMACTTCHNGVDSTNDKALAHSGNFLRHPSLAADEKCGSCHAETVTKMQNSLHAQGWGQKRMVYMRAGYSSFDQMPDILKQGYETNCAKCHASCGDCHVNRPKAGGGGLLNGHAFNSKPDMRLQCVNCHTSRGGHAFLGVAAGTVPDVHLTKAGFTCTSCHTATEMHGDGTQYDTRYQVADLAECTDCHTSVATSNVYHTMHNDDFSCYVCHSQDYNNCASCHIGAEGARVAAYVDYKIGMNPIATIKSQYKYSLLRRSLSAPDSWDMYGVANLGNFAAAPTYKYTSPHNIQKWTSRTQVDAGKSCSNNCHIVNEDGVYRNRDLYLFNSDLTAWELTADTGIVVDGRLPASWGTP